MSQDGKIDVLRMEQESFGKPMRIAFDPRIEAMEFLSMRCPEALYPSVEVAYLAQYKTFDINEVYDADKPLVHNTRELMVLANGNYIPNVREWIHLSSAPYKNTMYHLFERVQ